MSNLKANDFWRPRQQYYASDRIKSLQLHDDKLYICNETHTSGDEFDETKFILVSGGSDGGTSTYLDPINLSIQVSNSGVSTTVIPESSTYTDGILEPVLPLPILLEEVSSFSAYTQPIYIGSGVANITFEIPKRFGDSLQFLLYGIIDSSLVNDELGKVAIDGQGSGSMLFLTNNSSLREYSGLYLNNGVQIPVTIPKQQVLISNGCTLNSYDTSSTAIATPNSSVYDITVSTKLSITTATTIQSFINNQDDVGHEPQVIYFGYVSDEAGLENIGYMLSNPTSGYYANKLIAIGTDGSTFNLDSDISYEATVNSLGGLGLPSISLGNVNFSIVNDVNDSNVKILNYGNGNILTEALAITSTVGMKPFIISRGDQLVGPLTSTLEFNFNLPIVPQIAVLEYDFDTRDIRLEIDESIQPIGVLPNMLDFTAQSLKAVCVEVCNLPVNLPVSFNNFNQATLYTEQLPVYAKDGDLLPISVGGTLFGQTYEDNDLLLLADNKTKGIILLDSNLKRKVTKSDVSISVQAGSLGEHDAFTFPVENGKIYKITANIIWQSNNNLNGVSARFRNPTGTMIGNFSAPPSHNTITPLAIDDTRTIYTCSNTPQAGRPYLLQINMIYICEDDGDIVLTVGREQSGYVSTLKRGSYMEIESI